MICSVPCRIGVERAGIADRLPLIPARFFPTSFLSRTAEPASLRLLPTAFP